MPSLYSYLANQVIIFTLLWLASASPQLNFPISSQLPPVAYVGQLFEFTFSPITFTSAIGNLSYTLRSCPAWLSIDGAQRKITGIPTTQDIGDVDFQLVASDNTATLSSNITLTVLETSTLSKGEDVILQLADTEYACSSPSTLFLHPQQSFSFNLSRDVFDGCLEETIFYAISADRSPLPSWLQFDSKAIQFSGTTPLLPDPASSNQTYDISLAASNVAGFIEYVVTFQIAVVHRILAFIEPQINVTIPAGSDLEIASLIGQLNLDGNKIVRSDLNKIESDAPAWLTIDDVDMSLSGTAPTDVKSCSFSLEVSIDECCTANLTISLQPVDPQGVSHFVLDSFNAVAGQYFSQNLHELVDSGSKMIVAVNLGDLSTWLFFNSSSLTLQGEVPSHGAPFVGIVQLTCTHSNSTIIASIEIHVLVATAISSVSILTSRMIATSSSSSDPTMVTDVPRGKAHSSNANVLIRPVLGAVIPMVALLALVFLGVFCLRRKGNSGELSITTTGRSQSPVCTEPVENISTTPTPVPSIVTEVQDSSKQFAGPAPHLELQWAPNLLQDTRRRMSKTLDLNTNSICKTSWDDLVKSISPVPHRGTPAGVRSGPEVHYGTAMNFTTSRFGTFESAPSAPLQHSLTQVTTQSNKDGISEADPSITDMSMHWTKHASCAGHGAGHGANDAKSRQSWRTNKSSNMVPTGRTNTMLLDSPALRFSAGVDIIATSTDAPDRTGTLITSTPARDSHRRSILDNLEDTRRWQNIQLARNALTGHNMHDSKASIHDLGHRPNSDIRLSRIPSTGIFQPHRKVARPLIESNGKITEAASGRPLERVTSLASSRQFESALSSDDDWEDESLADNRSFQRIDPQQEGNSSRFALQSRSDNFGVGKNASRPSPKIVFDNSRNVVRDSTPIGQVESNDMKQTTWRNSPASPGSFRFV